MDGAYIGVEDDGDNVIGRFAFKALVNGDGAIGIYCRVDNVGDVAPFDVEPVGDSMC